MAAIVHNITAATRLFDVLHLLADSRVQVEFTVPGSSAFTAGTEEFLTGQGIRVHPWQSIVDNPPDLAISASLGGDLSALRPLLVLPHGMGYNKYLRETGNGKRETGNGKRETGNGKRETGNGHEGAFGISSESLLNANGDLIPTVLVLSHEEQRTRLARSCRQAVPISLVAGDPCLDRMTASLPLRPMYRRAFGVAPGQRLLVVSSTWGPGSLFAECPDLPDTLAELPLDEYRTVVALHPNIRAWHSDWQVAAWLARCTRAGLTILPAQDGWRAALIAADTIIGDHGSVTFYGAALGRPVFLATAPHSTVDPDSPIAQLLHIAPRYTGDPTAPCPDLTSVTALATSHPDKAAPLLRTEFYRLLNLPEPTYPPEVQVVPTPLVPPTTPAAQLIHVTLHNNTAAITRHASTNLNSGAYNGTHLTVDTTASPLRRELELAEILIAPDPTTAQELLHSLPGALLATTPLPHDRWLTLSRHNTHYVTTGLPTSHGPLGASLLHHLLSDHTPPTVPLTLTIHCGPRRFTATIQPAD